MLPNFIHRLGIKEEIIDLLSFLSKNIVDYFSQLVENNPQCYQVLSTGWG